MTPGSASAQTFGCLCCPIANNYGTGYASESSPNGIIYHIVAACPVHGSIRWLMPDAVQFNVAGNITTLVFGKMR